MQRVHDCQQDFAHPFRPAEIHDVGLIIREFSQTIELFWPCKNVESDSLGFAGRQGESWDLHCALDSPDRRLAVVDWEIHRNGPDLRTVGLLRSENCREILVAYRGPKDLIRGSIVHVPLSTRLEQPEKLAWIKVIYSD